MAREIERLAVEIRHWSERRVSHSRSKLDYIGQISRLLSPVHARNLDTSDQLDDKQIGLSVIQESASSIQSTISSVSTGSEEATEQATSAQSQSLALSGNAEGLDSSLSDAQARAGQIRARFTT